MAFYTETGKSTGFPILATIRNQLGRGINKVVKARARRAIYDETFVQLARLSNRELADIGISRANIRQVAMDEARKVTLK